MRRLALLVASWAAVSCAGDAFRTQAFNGHRLRTPIAKPAVEWQRTDGTPFRVAEATAGRVTLLYFGYTHCPDVCPTQLMHLATAMRHLGADTASRFDVLVVTIDPARDTANVLEEWVRGFHPRFIALRGSAESVTAEIARLELASPMGVDSAVASPDPAHAAAVVAFARDGLAHFLYPANTSPEAWAYDLRKLLRDSVP